MYRRIGIDATMEVARRGYYPRGGGIVKLKVEPTEGLTSLALAADSRGDVKICSVASKLPLSVAQRQAESCRRRLLNSGVKVEDVQSEVEDGVTPGTSLLVYHDSHGTVFGSDGIGEKGKPAELVGDEVAEKFIREYRSFASVDSHLADMLPHLLCLASRPSSYSVPEITEHLRSCLYVSQLVTGRSCEVTSGETLPVVRVSGVD
jgi:RNA 3'-terminal phosphate cyclase (ATP)